MRFLASAAFANLALDFLAQGFGVEFRLLTTPPLSWLFFVPASLASILAIIVLFRGIRT